MNEDFLASERLDDEDNFEEDIDDLELDEI